MTMAVSLAFLPGETLTRYKSLGLLLGFGGVLIVLAPWNLGVGGSVSSQVACLGATASYGISFVYLRRFVLPLGVATRTVALLQISIGAFVMVPALPVIANTPIHLTPAIVLRMIALGALGAGGAMIGYGAFITEVINFVILAFIIFLLVRYAQKAMAQLHKPHEEAPAGPTEVELLTEIRDELRRRA